MQNQKLPNVKYPNENLVSAIASLEQLNKLNEDPINLVLQESVIWLEKQKKNWSKN